MSESLTKEARAAEAAGRKRGVAEIVSVLDEPARGLVLEVVKRTRLRRKEKRRVAAELVGHFEDGVAGGESLEGLVKRFGEPVVVARLIRRAQKRQRGLLWKMWGVSWKGVVCFLVLYVAAGMYLATGRAVVEVDYASMLLEGAESIEGDDRAWPLYREAAMGLGDEPEFGGETEGWQSISNIREGSVYWGDAAAYIEAHEIELGLIREGAKRSGMGYSPRQLEDEDLSYFGFRKEDEYDSSKGMIEGSMLGMMLPHAGELRQLVRVMAFDARKAAVEGDGDRVVADLEAMIAMGGHARDIPVLICDLVGLAVDGLTIEVFMEVLSERPDVISNEGLLRLAHVFAGLDDRFELRMNGERLGFYDLLQRMYTPGDDGYLVGSLAVLGGENELLKLDAEYGSLLAKVGRVGALPAVTLMMASRGEVEAEYDRYMDRMVSAFSRPMWEWEKDIEAEELDFERNRLQKMRYLPMAIMVPSIRSAGEVFKRSETKRDAMLVAVALELYKRRHGGWPASLDELVPGLLPEVPRDPYTGEGLGYVVGEDGRPIVYSVGRDGDDDGGRWAAHPNDGVLRPYVARESVFSEEVPDGDWGLWPVE